MENNDTLSLESLTQKYNTLLQSYNTTVNQYVSYLNTGEDSNGNLEEISNMQIINGLNVINSIQANTVDDCKALCSSVANCTMANYNSDSKNCVIGTKNGKVTLNKSKDTDYAFLVDKIYYTTLLSNLNDELNITNTNIMNVLSNEGNSQYSNLDSENQNVKSQLKMNNDILKARQNEMQGMSKDISLLELKHIHTESELVTNSYYYWFLFLLVALIVFYFYCLH